MNTTRRPVPLGVLLLCLQVLAGPVSAESPVKGQVTGSDGNPLGDARVVVYSAVSRQASADLSEAISASRGAVATTDGSGRFEFEQLSAELIYTLAIAADGHEGRFVKFDSEANAPFEVKLEKPPENQSRRIRGNVVDEQGNPLANVVLNPRHISIGSTTYGRNQGYVSNLSLSNESGEFEFSATDAVGAFAIQASAPRRAIAQIRYETRNDKPTTIKLGTGASIRGRLVFKGKPTAGLKLGLVQEDRSIESVLTPMTTVTDQDGVFRFDHIPAMREYAIYSLLQQDAQQVLPVSLVTAPGHSKRAELGDVELKPARKLSIQLRTNDKQPLPEKSYVYVARSKAWQSARFDPAGKVDPTLEIKDAGSEVYEIGVRIPGYKVVGSIPRRSPDINKRYRITVDGDTSLALLLRRED